MRVNRFLFVVCVCLMAVVGSAEAEAATLRVCASGCTYTSLQAAIDAAAPGDTILLRAGETFVGPFILRAKPNTGAWITIRSDASDTLLPADGVRLVPSGKPGANTSRSLLPRLIGQGGALKTTPVIRTATGANHYILKFLEIDGVANLGFETLISLGVDTTAATASDIVIDRVYAHGDAYRGMKRGIQLNSVRTDVLNSYISDIKAVNADSQAIGGHNGAGPFRIINNYLEAAGENIMFGGSDPAVTNLVPSDIEIRRNHLFKPLEWRNAIMKAPASPRASAAAGGSLAGGTHYFKVVALMSTDTITAVSLASAEVSATVSAGQAVSLSWSAVPGADKYRIYRGTSAGGQTRYMTTSSSGTSFTYTGSSESSGSPGSGTKWTVKNLFELKNAQRVTVDGNIFENVWAAGQYGYALLLTPRNQNGGASWVRVRDVTFTNNIVRHASGVLQLAGRDATNVSQQTQRITLRNNLFYDIDPGKYGGSAKGYLIGEGAADVVIDRNTLIHTNSAIVWAYGADTTGFVYTNNIAKHGTYGIFGDNGRAGTYSISMYFPSANVTYNVFAGGTASAYPAPNSFPTLAQWNASFVDLAGEDFRLLSTSPFFAAGQGGTVPGADIGKVYAAVNGGTSTPPPPDTTVPPPPQPTNTPPVAKPGGPYAGTVGVQVAVSGTGSSDSDGTIAAYRWTFGDEIVVRAADVAASDIVGSKWVRQQMSDAAGGWAMRNPDAGAAKASAPAAAPASYVDVRFYAAAGVPYQVWFRMQAESGYYGNDSMFVQFSGAVNSSGTAIDRIGTQDAAIIVLEEGSGAGLSGWGWNDEGYGTLAAPVYFDKTGYHTLRVQQREDGIIWDQVVISSATYAKTRPGATKNDTTIVKQPSAATVTTAHVYAVPGTFPVVLQVTDNDGAVSSAMTTATVGAASGSTAVTASASGPYAGAAGQPIVFDGSSSVVSGAATYEWSFGDRVVLHASQLKAVGSRWRSVSSTSAAGGIAMENPDLGQAKIGQPLGAPASYVEGTFKAAAGVPYRMWIRMRAAGDYYGNDSIHVQFSGSVSSSGAAIDRIGSTDAVAVVLEEGSGAGVQGWGWADGGYGTLGTPIYFNQDGAQTLRIQQREDGMIVDQVVISAADFYAAAPGTTKSDTTIVPVVDPDGATATSGHAYRAAGVYPVTLTVRAGSSVSTDSTTATVR